MSLPVTACRRDTRRVRRPFRGVPGSPERAPRGPGRVAVSEAGPGTALQGAVNSPGGSADGQGSSEPLPSVEVRFGFGGEAGDCIRAGPCRGTGSAAAVFGRRPARRGPGGKGRVASGGGRSGLHRPLAAGGAGQGRLRRALSGSGGPNPYSRHSPARNSGQGPPDVPRQPSGAGFGRRALVAGPEPHASRSFGARQQRCQYRGRPGAVHGGHVSARGAYHRQRAKRQAPHVGKDLMGSGGDPRAG